LRKKIIGMSLMMAFLMLLYAHSVAAQNDVTLFAWTGQVQYKPGETGKLYITVRNDLPDTDLIIKNITIIYTNWEGYVVDHWEGNVSFTDIDEICTRKGGVFNKEVEFTVPTDGRGVTTYAVITLTTDKLPPIIESISINVVGPSAPITFTGLDTWMTSLIVSVVVCTIILAIVVLLATRKTRAPRALVTRAPAPPRPPKPKAKA